MSKFGGQFDLYDEITMCVSDDKLDIFGCFAQFEKDTNGVISKIEQDGIKEIHFTKLSEIAPYFGYAPATVGSHLDSDGVRHTSITIAKESNYEWMKKNYPEGYKRIQGELNDLIDSILQKESMSK